MTKARTVAEKRRGRKRKQTERYANGQPKKETPQKIMETAVSARMRVFGLSEKDARQQFAGTFVGRARQANQLSPDQFEAAYTYAQIVLNYRTAIQSPGKITRGRSAGLDDGEYDERCKAAVKRYDQLVATLREVDRAEKTNCLGVLEPAILRDVDMHHMMGDLRLALNAIHRWNTKQKQAA